MSTTTPEVYADAHAQELVKRMFNKVYDPEVRRYVTPKEADLRLIFKEGMTVAYKNRPHDWCRYQKAVVCRVTRTKLSVQVVFENSFGAPIDFKATELGLEECDKYSRGSTLWTDVACAMLENEHKDAAKANRNEAKEIINSLVQGTSHSGFTPSVEQLEALRSIKNLF